MWGLLISEMNECCDFKINEFDEPVLISRLCDFLLSI
jgi:hypothetical protein